MNARVLILAAAGLLSGCGGGGGGAVGVPPAPSPSPAATSTPPANFTGTAVGAIPAGTRTALSVTLPDAGGFGGSMLLPATSIPVDTTIHINETLTNAPPAGVVALQTSGRTAQSTRTVANGASSPLLYVGASFDSPFTLSSSIGLDIRLPNGLGDAPGQQYYLAAYDTVQQGTGWRLGYAGPATAAGGTVSFDAPSSTFPVTPGRLYAFALYRAPLATPPPIVLSKIYFQFPGASADPSFTAREAGYSGTFGATLACVDPSGSGGSPASVSPASSAPAVPGGAVTFTVSTHHSGGCVATISDTNGARASIQINVSATYIGIQ